MANASLMAGIAFSNSMVGMIHAIGHALGGVSRVPHGDAMAILMPYCMKYNLDKLNEEYAELLLPIAGSEIYSQTKKEDRAMISIQTIEKMLLELNQLTGLPTHLRDVKVNREDFKKIVQTALNDGALLVNPKKVDREDILNILEQAY